VFPLVLVLAAVVIVLVGLTRLGTSGPHATPWTALFVWAALFGIGLSVWLFAARLR